MLDHINHLYLNRTDVVLGRYSFEKPGIVAPVRLHCKPLDRKVICSQVCWRRSLLARLQVEGTCDGKNGYIVLVTKIHDAKPVRSVPLICTLVMCVCKFFVSGWVGSFIAFVRVSKSCWRAAGSWISALLNFHCNRTMFDVPPADLRGHSFPW